MGGQARLLARVGAAGPRGKTRGASQRRSPSVLVCLLAHDLDVVVSENRISDSEMEALLLAGNNVGRFNCEDKAAHGTIWEGTPYTAR